MNFWEHSTNVDVYKRRKPVTDGIKRETKKGRGKSSKYQTLKYGGNCCKRKSS